LKACIRSNENLEIIREGYKKIVQLLIKYNANINAQNNILETPLHNGLKITIKLIIGKK
jgi:ankyrin repeat protein